MRAVRPYPRRIHYIKGQKSCGCLSLDSRFRKILSDDKANLRVVINHYSSRAKKRGFVWNLTEDEATNLLLSPCHYCKVSPNREVNYLHNTKSQIVSGIDRKNNKFGYILENCVPCCKICNRAKLNSTLDEFLFWVKGLIKNFDEKNI